MLESRAFGSFSKKPLDTKPTLVWQIKPENLTWYIWNCEIPNQIHMKRRRAMYLCRELIAKHRGEILAANTGQGAKITVKLKLNYRCKVIRPAIILT